MENKLKKANKLITNVVRELIVILIVFMAYKRSYKNVGILALTMCLTFYEGFFNKILKIKLSEKLKISFILFIAGAQIFGTVLEFYHKFFWWDTMLHFTSGIIAYFVGETVINGLNEKTTKANISKTIIIAFSIFFALASGVAWEIFEFVTDITLGQNMQITEGLSGRNAVMDTMVDLISLTLGTVIICIIDIYRKKKVLIKS